MLETFKKFILIFVCVICAVLIFFKVDLIRMGGYVMFPMVLSSLFAFTVIFAKIRQFSISHIDLDSFLKNIFECIERHRIKEAIDLCDHSESPMAYVLKVGIMKYDCQKDEIKEAMESAFLDVVPVFEEGLSILSSIIQILPLLGFLGVAVGMVHIFQVVRLHGMSFAGCWTQDFSFCIWEALICSIASLVLSIILLSAYNFLIAKAGFLVDEMERGCGKLLNFLLERRMPL